MTMQPDEYSLLGIAVVYAQRVEFAIYGLAAHFPNSADKLLKKRLASTTPEDFLRGDVSKLTITLGQLAKGFGPAIGLEEERLDRYIEDRNIVAHSFYRLFHMDIPGVTKRENPAEWLRLFIANSARLERDLRMLMYEIRVQGARASGDSDKLPNPREPDLIEREFQSVGAALLTGSAGSAEQ